jgi:AraC-like DNA-binding protein
MTLLVERENPAASGQQAEGTSSAMPDRSHRLASGVDHSHFDTRGTAPIPPLLAWRERVGHVIDVLSSSAEIENPFSASIDRYAVGELAFTDCRSDRLHLDRSIARISTDDRVRDYAFHVFLEGGIESISGHYPHDQNRADVASLVALDMDQPARMQRSACRVLTVFAPAALVETVVPDADAMHGRVIENRTPLTRLLVQHVAAVADSLPGMSADEAQTALRTSAQLLVAAFGKEARLTGNARAAARAAMVSQVKRYIRDNLHQAELSPENLIQALQLPRPTLYRMFHHEGGLGTYIRNLRLRAAADELVRFPHLAVTDIAYGLGFKSPSDFTRAFRRAYEISPRDFRARALESRRR